MAKRARGLLRGCGIGCGAVALLLVLGLMVIGVRTCVPLRSAGRDLERLEARFGSMDRFAPAPDGAIPAERLRVFLGVRRALTEPCANLEAMWGRLRRVDRIGEGAEPTGAEIAATTKGFAEVAADIAPRIGELFERRNRALFEAEMGLGEYAYIFVLAHRGRLLDDAMDDELFAERGPISPETAEALRAMLAHQLEAAGTEPDDGIGQLLEREIRAMEADAGRLPWQDGPPPAVERSLAAFREQLDESFCLTTAGIAVDRDASRAMAIALR